MARSTRGVPRKTGRRKPIAHGAGVRGLPGTKRSVPSTGSTGIRGLPTKPGQRQAPPSLNR